MKENLEALYDPEKFRTIGHEVIDLLANYLVRCKNDSSMNVMPTDSPEKVLEFWEKKLSDPKQKFTDYVSEVIEDSTKVHHPRYVGHQVSAPSPLLAMIDMVSALLNNGMAVFEMGAASTSMEKIVIDWLNRKIGWSEGGGLITSGGSLANLTAILAARQAKVPGYWDEGNKHKNLTLMVSEEAHYSVERAVKILGWGEEGIIKVPTDEKFKLIPGVLQETYDKAHQNGKQVIAVIGCACTTSTGSFDPLVPIGNFCRQNKLWFHVDAAHGGPVIFSDKLRHRAEGLNLADSVIIDFHKMMLTPALATALVFKNNNHAYQIFSQKASYLLEKEEKRWHNAGLKTIECTKRMIATKVYTMLKYAGEKIFDDFITQTHNLALYFAGKINQAQDFELATEPELNIVCFRYNDLEKNIKTINSINEDLRKKIIQSGEFYVVKTLLRGKIYLRITIMSPFTNQLHLDGLFNKIRSILRDLFTY